MPYLCIALYYFHQVVSVLPVFPLEINASERILYKINDETERGERNDDSKTVKFG